MTTTLKICTSILLGLLCILTNTKAAITNLYTYPSVELFENIHAGTDKKRFVDDATYFTLNKAALAQIQQQKLETISLQIPFGVDKNVEVALNKISIFGDDFKVTTQKGDTHNTLSYSPGLFYRGSISGAKDALVTVNFFKETMTGVLSLNGENYNLGQYGDKDSETYVLYKERNLNASNPFACSAEDPKELVYIRPTNGSGARSKSTVEIYVECDYFLFKANGASPQKTTDFVTGLFNVVASIYAIDDIDVKLSEVKIWESRDPYPTNSAKAARDAFGKALDGNFNGDVAHLLSNYKVNGTVPNGGSANIDALCNKEKAVGYTNITTGYNDYPTFSWTAYAVTHEIGHNLGSPHTHSCLWPTGPIDNCWCPEGDCDLGPEPVSSGGTVMSYCHLNPQWTNDCDLSAANPGINLAAGFGELPGALIRNRIDAANCLGADAPVIPFQAAAKVTDDACNQSNGTITLTVSFGQTPYTYKWSNGATTKDLQNLVAGNYTVTVTDANGKTTTVSGVVNSTEPFAMDAGPDHIIGCTEPIVTLDGSNSPSGFAYAYEWSVLDGNLYGNVRKPTLAVSEPGTYVLTISNDDTGCVVKDTVEVAEDFSQPIVFISTDDLSCANTSTTIKTNPQTEVSKFEWTGPNDFSTQSANPLISQAGTYNLIATGENGCTLEKSIEVIGDTETPILMTEATNISCANPTGELAAFSNMEVTYQWIGPNNFNASNQNEITSHVGIYTVTATALNGCSAQSSVTVNELSEIPTLQAQGGTLSCIKSAIQLNATSDEPVTYQWTGPAGFESNTQNPEVDRKGIYTVKVTTANGCVNETSVEVKEDNAIPTLSVEGGILACNNSKVQLNAASDTEVTYQWTGPNNFQSNQQNPEVELLGTYTIQIMNLNGCANEATVTVVEDTDLPEVSAKAGTLSCSNATTELVVISEQEGLNFKWTGPNGFTSFAKEPKVSKAGIYQLEATRFGGCKTTISVEVEADFSMPQIDISGGEITCDQTSTTLKGLSNDVIEKYIWTGENGFLSNESSIAVNGVGLYELTVVGGNGCATSELFEVVADNSLPTFDLKSNDISCVNENANLKVICEESASFDFVWTGPVGFTSREKEPEVSLPGVYSLEVTNDNGCSKVKSIEVKTMEQPTIVFATLPTLSCNQEQVTIDATASILSPNVMVEWTTEDGNIIHQINELMVTVDKAGTYALTVRDLVTECVVIEAVTVETMPDVAARIESNSVLTCSNSSVKLSASNSTISEHTVFEWITETGRIISDKNAQEIEVDAPGNYSLFVTDTLTGCTDATFTAVTAARTVEAALEIPKMISCSQPTTTLSGANSRLNASSKIQWYRNDNVIPNSNGLFLTVNATGTYMMKIIDTLNQCEASAEMRVSAHEKPEVRISKVEQDACGKGEGSIALNINTNSLYSVEWDNGMEGEKIENLTAGIYTATVTDQFGCQVLISENIPAIAPISLREIQVQPITCHDSANGVIEVDLQGGNFPYETQWSNGATGLIATELATGTHTLEVMDAKGCVKSFDFPISAPNPLNLDLEVAHNDVMATVSGGKPDYQFEWSDGSTEIYGANFSKGVHNVMVTDANGCSVKESFEIDAITPTKDILTADLEIMTFPNPTSDYFRIKKAMEGYGKVGIAVYSATGEQMFVAEQETYDLDATVETMYWQPGTYFLHVQSKEGTSVNKIQVIKK